MQTSSKIMKMNKAERRAINRQNARNSTGPKTVEGKLASRRNALKDGLTAQLLILPNETPEVVKAQNDAWFEALLPASQDELDLVKQLAYTSLRMQRFSKTENALLTAQVLTAEARWDVEQQNRVLDVVANLIEKPARVMIELKSFAGGLRWLLERWNRLKLAFDACDCWNNVALIEEATRLRGFDPLRLPYESPDAFSFVFAAACAAPFDEDELPFMATLRGLAPAAWIGQYGEPDRFESESSARLIKGRIDAEILDLTNRLRPAQSIETLLREGAQDRAMVLADTPATRNMMRYMKATESGFDRGLKTLAKLQAERRKGLENLVEIEVEIGPEAGNQNEPKWTGHATANPAHPGSYVVLNDKEYIVDETGDGHIMLSPVDPLLWQTILGLAAAPNSDA